MQDDESIDTLQSVDTRLIIKSEYLKLACVSEQCDIDRNTERIDWRESE